MPDLRYDDQDDRATWADPHDIPAMCGLEHLHIEELERRLGELLAETVEPRGAGNTRLPEGISKMQSSRWQLSASLPEEADPA